jgi:hypothetical protein
MKLFLITIIAALCAASVYGQTLKALMYNSSNGIVVQSNIKYRADQTEIGVSYTENGNTTLIDLGKIGWVNNLQSTFRLGDSSPTNIVWFSSGVGAGGFGATGATITFDGLGSDTNVFLKVGNNSLNFAISPTFTNATVRSTTRTNLSLGLPALTNTSNVTMMRALAGSTNTNQPYSGSFTFSDGSDLYILNVSNGIILGYDQL